MSDERIFQKALTNFTFDVACGSAIRHMVDKGCTEKQVTERLDYPLSYEKAQRAVTVYLAEKGVLLFSEPDFSKTHTKAEYVKEYGPNGKASFHRGVREQTEAV